VTLTWPNMVLYSWVKNFFLTSDKGKTVSAWKQEGGGRGKGGVMTQSLYALMNKVNLKKRIFLHDLVWDK
jgi:hypothetical protein